jgi:hypothetical protein
MIKKKLFSEMQNGCKKPKNLMLIMNQLEKSHAKKVINVTKNRVFDFLLLCGKVFGLSLFWVDFLHFFQRHQILRFVIPTKKKE